MNHPESWDSDASWRTLTNTSTSGAFTRVTWSDDEDDDDGDRGSKVPSRPRTLPPSLSAGAALPVPV